MLMQEPSPEMINEWKDTFNKHRATLVPNKKTGQEILTYLVQKYPITELREDAKKQVVIDNIIQNECHAAKLPDGKMPTPRVFLIENTGLGTYLYENQDDVFAGNNIIVGIDLVTAYYLVEGSSLLWDELFAFRGLDNDDINNFYLVAEYIACTRKFDVQDHTNLQKP
ncbi:hypothetical protein [Methanospirillum lacunae]|uniref:Uncharacterized protein n=2 Tax=Methanospirillum lacunae TaxID=668570 RepID=A0A2V2N529_9EURY|nr:hypothetical protein [Methanospirillum lacunae]PWR73700.1 hypothetical protein DK846_00570 [Methanospirillum lacunae]